METMFVAAIAAAVLSVFMLHSLIGGKGNITALARVRHGENDARHTPDGDSGRA